MNDVIVAGAGPAGNIAAYKMSRMGYDVSVLDLRETLGDKLCTGIVGRECVERFPPDEADVLREAQSAIVISPSGKSHRIAKEKPQAYVIDRVAFVASLARRASEAGASYRLGERIVAIEPSNSGLSIRTASRTGTGRYETRMVIIASGFRSPLLRMVGLAPQDRIDYMVGTQAEVLASNLVDTEVYLGDGVAPGSFGWLVPFSEERALVGLVSRHRLNGHMGSFMSGLTQMGKIRSVTKQPKQWGIPIRPLPRTFADRVLVAGDAAGFVKPTTGGGIYYALLSGEIAAGAVHGAFETGDFSAGKLKGYEREWKAVFGRELRIGYYARRLYEALEDEQIEHLLNEFVSAHVHDEFMSSRELSFDWHSGLILKAIGHKELGKLLKSFGPMAAPFLRRLSRSLTARSSRGTDIG